jgi:hypothetical protein
LVLTEVTPPMLILATASAMDGKHSADLPCGHSGLRKIVLTRVVG